MNVLRSQICFLYGGRCKSIYILHYICRRSFQTARACQVKSDLNMVDGKAKFEELLHKYQSKILYNCYVESTRNRLSCSQKERQRDQRELLKIQRLPTIPLSLKYLDEYVDKKVDDEAITAESANCESGPQFPYNATNLISVDDVEGCSENVNHNIACIADLEISSRFYAKQNSNWMSDYDNYDDESIEQESSGINYGTPDPKCSISHVPCGGCGAYLHCKDSAIPGYVPSEIFKSSRMKGGKHLKAVICQRCHFLQHYNLALQVCVTSHDYPKVLATIGNRKQALVVLMVDLLDFPCSIWPGIADLIGYRRPIVVVGNKVDLLPQDGKGFLERVQKSLETSVHMCGFAMANIKHVSLISAKTGFGVENLITKLQSIWQYKGDVFLVGCTNVGKSSLFNILLQSDYCKSQAADLIQRATTSPWPGTTLNLLKFPIMRPTGWRLYVRSQRLNATNKLVAEENKLRLEQLRGTKNSKFATLIGHMDRTFPSDETTPETSDPFSVQGNPNVSDTSKVGINEHDPQYATSKYCFDTPGVVQPDQITDLLTTEELVLTFPKDILQPRCFNLKPGSTMFIGGLGRLDFVEGPTTTRFTVFRANTLPVTVCRTKDAEDIYNTFVGSPLFAVPVGYSERLKLWPQLKAGKDIKCTGIDEEYSCIDVVLSSSGWISVTCKNGEECTLTGWTPDARGIKVRESLLPKAVSLRGKKFNSGPAYKTGKFYKKK